MKPIYDYKNIVIDTDLEPDDKAALEVFFRSLAIRHSQDLNFVMPNITIIAGSSTRPALKVLQAQEIINNLRLDGFIPNDAPLKIIQGSATSKHVPKDGYDLIEPGVADSIKVDKESKMSEDDSNYIAKTLQQENTVFVGLRHVGDLCAAIDKINQQKPQNAQQKLPADFMGTLSFNVTSVTYKEEGGANVFVKNYLSQFNDSLCYEGFHSALNKNSTGKAWPQLREVIASMPYLLAAHQLWDEDNIEDCYRTLSDKDYKGNKIDKLGITDEQALKAKQLFEEAIKNRNDGVYQKLDIAQVEAQVSKFEDAILDIFGTDVRNKVKSEVTPENPQEKKKKEDAQQAFLFNFNPFASMIFYAPQLCLADLCFMSVVTNPELLRASMQHKALSYNGRFSKVDVADKDAANTQYIILNEEQLKEAGDYVHRVLKAKASPVVELNDNDVEMDDLFIPAPGRLSQYEAYMEDTRTPAAVSAMDVDGDDVVNKVKVGFSG